MYTLRQLKEFDTIDITDHTDEIYNWFINNVGDIGEYNVFLNEGVVKARIELVAANREATIYIHFKETSEAEMNIKIYALFDDYSFKYMCNAILQYKSEDNFQFKLLYPEEQPEALDKIFVAIFWGAFAYIDHIKNNKDTEIKYEKRVRGTVPRETAEKKPGKRVINISKEKKIIYKLKLNEEAAKEFKRSYERHTEAWNVAGHYRKYKSGKIVYVKPFTKGEGKIQNKIYKL